MITEGSVCEVLKLRPLLCRLRCHAELAQIAVTVSSCGTDAVQMLIEARQLHDTVLETRVQLAKTTNRLIQLDNPVLRTKIKELKRKADAVIAEHGV